MKQKLLLFLMALAVLRPSQLKARDFQYTYEGQTVTYTVIDEDAKTCMTKSGNNISGQLVIPEIAEARDYSYSVTEIDDESFMDCKELISVTIPNSVVLIGEVAFGGCTGLTSFKLGESIKIIGKFAFIECESIKTIEIPNSVIEIGIGAFENCRGVHEIKLPNSLEKIGNLAFSGCSRITYIEIPSSVTAIGIGAFLDCQSLTEIPILPNSITSLSSQLFAGCSGLLNVVIPNTITHLGEECFNRCSNLITIKIPDSVVEIGDNAFTECRNLNSLELPNFINKIGFCAFDRCTNLRTIKIPSSVTSIDPYAFSSCTSLKSVYYAAVNPIEGEERIFDTSTYADGILYLPELVVAKCKTINPWKNFHTIQSYDFEIAESIELNQTEAKIKEEETVQLTATVLPAEASDKSVAWSSSDETVATVEANGLVKGVKAGTATITAKTANGLTATCSITVDKKSGIDGVDDGSQIRVIAREGVIIVEAPEGLEVEVYSIAGLRVAQTREHRIEGLGHGVYIVRVGGKTLKVVV